MIPPKITGFYFSEQMAISVHLKHCNNAIKLKKVNKSFGSQPPKINKLIHICSPRVSTFFFDSFFDCVYAILNIDESSHNKQCIGSGVEEKVCKSKVVTDAQLIRGRGKVNYRS